jgi:hypothetical protein
LFEREHHRNVALVLQSLQPELLAQRHCLFGGGTAMALRHGEYRESIDIDFRVADLAGYRELRQLLTGAESLAPLTRPGMHIELAREVRADQYGIRTHVRGASAVIKFEIILEGRIALSEPGPEDVVCGVQTLTGLDLSTEKLLANADRWADDSVFSRDLIDLAMQRADRKQLLAACAKAEGAYGASVRQSIAQAVGALRKRPHRLDECMKALGIDKVTKAQLWQAIRGVQRGLPAPD